MLAIPYCLPRNVKSTEYIYKARGEYVSEDMEGITKFVNNEK